MIFLKNSAGLFSDLSFVPLISAVALAALKNHMLLGHGSEDLKELVNVLHQLPCRRKFCPSATDFPRPNNFTTPPQYGCYTSDMHGVMIAGKFKTSSPQHIATDIIRSATPEGLGWAHVDRLRELVSATNKELEALGIDIPPDNLTRLASTLKKSSQWLIVEPDIDNTMSAKCYAIYRPDAQGFLGGAAATVPLTAARLFESAKAANDVINSAAKPGSAVVVSVSLKVEGLEPNQANAPSAMNELGLLGHGLIEKQAAILQDGTPEAPPTPPTTRRRM